MTDTRYDCIIVGGGTAGCVLANRLSAAGDRRVLLLEAGPDVRPGAEPADILDTYPTSYYNLGYAWQDLRGTWTGQAVVPMRQARVLGGGSSIMGMVALRGTPADYDEWAQAGAKGWDWGAVLPYFNRLESDQDFAGPLHGRTGPVPVVRAARSAWSPFQAGMHRYAASAGIPEAPDLNGDFADGIGQAPQNRFADRRASASICYLDPAVRRRPNLDLRTDVRVTRILCEGRTATGVLAVVDGAATRFRAGEVIVAAGALHTPTLLMRSGIGPAAHLAGLGLPVVADVPGVGRNLQNHQLVYTVLHLRRGCRADPAARRHTTAIDRYSSGVADCPPSDMYLSLISQTGWHALGTHFSSLAAALLKPFSRGRVLLDAARPLDRADIAFDFLADPRDARRLAGGLRRVAGYLRSEPLRGMYHGAVPVSNAAGLRAFNNVNLPTALRTRAIATFLDLAPGLGRLVLDRMNDRPVDLQQLVEDDDALLDFVRRSVSGMSHPVGTCRMGSADDPLAVVGPDGRVHGVGGLRVADASVMPTLPRGNTNLPTLMVGEKMADAVMDARA